jgi:tetratricopeptide (TPR) repeat protein
VRVAASIEGLAGIGKTELALHLVDRLSETNRFPGGIFWLDAENPDVTVAWGTTIADALAVGSGTVEERAASAVRIASSGPPVLVVLDNVERWTRDSEPRPLPHGSRTSLLVTTRRRFLAGPSFEHHTLETLSPVAARAFLSAVAECHLVGEDDLLLYLGGHSLAIELAGAYLREFPAATPDTYLQKLTEGVAVEERVQDLVRYEATVSRALDVHWAQLDDQVRENLLVAACFGQDYASVELLEFCGVDADAQQPLRRFHLISGDGERWRMHRLVRQWARRKALPEKLVGARRRFVQGCADLSSGIAHDDGYRIYRIDGQHLEEAARDAETILAAGDERVGVLLNGLAAGLYSIGNLPRAKQHLERALCVDLKNFGEAHETVATRQSNLALVLRDLGDLQHAKELLVGALTSDLKNLGEDHPVVAIRRSNLALLLRYLGDLPQAKALLEKALASSQASLGEEHPIVETNMSNLAVILKDLGDLPRAKELLEKALLAGLKFLGEDHPTMATRKSNLALVLQELGDLPRAKQLLESALTSNMKNLGADHPAVATAKANLALVLHASGEMRKAKDLLESALASDLRTFGADHPTVARVKANLAVVLHELGELPRTKELLESALASDLKNLGEDHPTVAKGRFNLASLSRNLGDLAYARELFSKALAASERTLGPDHPSTSVTRIALAEVLLSFGEAESARSEAERALRAITRQPEGSVHRVTVETAAEYILRRT